MHKRPFICRQAVIKNADMAEDMQQDAIDCATQVGTDVSSLEIGRRRCVDVVKQIKMSCLLKLFEGFKTPNMEGKKFDMAEVFPQGHHGAQRFGASDNVRPWRSTILRRISQLSSRRMG